MKKKKFRSQKTCQIKKGCGIYLSLSGLTLQDLSPGSVLGYLVKDGTERYFAHMWVFDFRKESESP